MFDTIWAPKMKKPETVLGEGIHTIPKLFLFWDMSASIYLEPDEMVDHEPDAVYDGPSPFYSPIC